MIETIELLQTQASYQFTMFLGWAYLWWSEEADSDSLARLSTNWSTEISNRRFGGRGYEILATFVAPLSRSHAYIR